MIFFRPRYLPELCYFWRWNPARRINIYFRYFVFTSRVKNAVFSHWNKVSVNNKQSKSFKHMGVRGRWPHRDQTRISTPRLWYTLYSENSHLTWPQIFFGDLQMFVLSVSLVTTVTTVGMMGMMASSIMSSFVVPLLARKMKSNVDMSVTWNLIVAQFVICRIKIMRVRQGFFSQYFPSIWLTRVKSHLAASV